MTRTTASRPRIAPVHARSRIRAGAATAVVLVIAIAQLAMTALTSPAQGALSESTVLSTAGLSRGGQVPAATRTADKSKVGFGIVPATATDLDVRALFSYGLTPGTVANDHVALVNYSQHPLSLDVYPTDALIAADGGFAFGTAVEHPTDLGSWIQLGRDTGAVEVPGRRKDGSPGRVILPVSITVPADAEPGDHAAGIVASLVSLGKNPKGQNLRLEQRVASRVYLRVDGPLHPDLAVTALHAEYDAPAAPWEAGSMRVTYTITNGGNIRMGYDPSIVLSGPFGTGRRTIDGKRVAELLPRSSHTVSTTIHGVWPTGYHHVTVTAAATAPVAGAAPKVAPARAGVRVWTIPWILLAVLVLLIAAVTAERWRRRRNAVPPTSTGRRPAREQVPVGRGTA